MKIIYTIKEDYSLVFNHIFEDDYILKKGEFEISQEEFDKLFSVGGDIRLNPFTNKIELVPNPEENFIKGVFNPLKWEWEESLSLNEKVEYYKNKIIQKTRELAVIETAGFRDEKLEKELEEVKAIHMELSHELANEINLRY